MTPPLTTVEIDPLAAAGVEEAVALLRELGHEVEEIDPPWVVDGLFDLFAAAFGPAVASAIVFVGTLAGRELTAEDMEPLSWHLWQQAQGLGSAHYIAAIGQLQALARTLVAATADYDAVLTPSLAQRPVEIGTLFGGDPDPAATFRRSGRFTPFTSIANVTGQPAISVPLSHGADGLPTGVHFFGRPAQEGPLLALAAQLEAARPWADRRPDTASVG
jgi:amidase